MNAPQELYDERADIQISAENLRVGDECWKKLAVAHRLLQRIEDNELEPTSGVIEEIRQCFNLTLDWLSTFQPQPKEN